MPRRRQRFSRLDAELKASGGTAAAGTRAADFLNFRKGVNKIVQTRRPNSASMARFSVGVVPFGITPAATPKSYQATMTNQAEQIRALFTAAAAENAYGISNFDNTTVIDSLFYPALVKIFITTLSEVSTTKQSDILKSSPAYKRFKGRSGSVPFGRTISSTSDAVTAVGETAVADVDEEDVRRSLAADLKGAIGTGYKVKGVSFVPESWGSKINSPGAKPATLAALQAPG